MHQLEHNKHHITLNLFGRELYPCARCFGMYLGIIFLLPFVMYLYFNSQFDFQFIFVLSWILASLAIIDWASVKIGFRTGTNSMRMATGFLLGIGSIIYLFLLPSNIFLNAVHLWVYGLAFSVIAYIVWCKRYNLSLRNPISQNIQSIVVFSAVPLTAGAVPCSCTQTGGCCNFCAIPGCSTGCCCSPCMVCCCTLPLLCFLPTILKWFKGWRKPKGGTAKSE